MTEADKHRLVFHRGGIATGNAVIQNGDLRDQISERCDWVLCVELEAAGVDVNIRCLITLAYLTMHTRTRTTYRDLTRLKMRLRSLESCSAGFSARWLRKWKG